MLINCSTICQLKMIDSFFVVSMPYLGHLTSDHEVNVVNCASEGSDFICMCSI